MENELEIVVEREELELIERASEVLERGGDVRGPFLDQATQLLVRAGQCIASDRFVYVDGMKHFTREQWAIFVHVTHAATFAARLAQAIGADAQEHVDAWRQDVVPALQRLIERAT